MSARSPWTLVLLADEAARNLAANRVRTALVVLVATTCLVGGASWDLVSLDGSRRDEAALIDRGRTTVVLQPREPGPAAALDARSCASIDGRPGVVAAGPVWETPGLTLVQAPHRSVPAVVVSQGGAEALVGRPVPPGASALVSEGLADEFALAPGGSLAVLEGSEIRSLPVDRVVALGRRRVDLDLAVAVLGFETRPADQCWIEFVPGSPDDVLVGAAGMVHADIAPEVRLVVPPDGLQRSPEQQVRGRASRIAGVAGGVVVALVWAALAWGRRREIGLYRSVGVSRPGVAVLLLFELAVTIAVAGWLAGATGLGVGSVLGWGLLGWALWSAAGSAVCALAVGATIAAFLVRSPVMEQLKD